jgi:hypothetical protein
MDKVRMRVHPELETPEQLDDEFSEVSVRLGGGAEFSCRRKTSERTGSAANPLSWRQLAEKYASCARGVLDDRAISESEKMVKRLDRVGDVRKLVAALAARE